jgi:hypothetical protein
VPVGRHLTCRWSGLCPPVCQFDTMGCAAGKAAQLGRWASLANAIADWCSQGLASVHATTSRTQSCRIGRDHRDGRCHFDDCRCWNGVCDGPILVILCSPVRHNRRLGLRSLCHSGRRPKRTSGRHALHFLHHGGFDSTSGSGLHVHSEGFVDLSDLVCAGVVWCGPTFACSRRSAATGRRASALQSACGTARLKRGPLGVTSLVGDVP